MMRERVITKCWDQSSCVYVCSCSYLETFIQLVVMRAIPTEQVFTKPFKKVTAPLDPESSTAHAACLMREVKLWEALDYQGD
jgi:hypothetical protein